MCAVPAEYLKYPVVEDLAVTPFSLLYVTLQELDRAILHGLRKQIYIL